MKDYDENEEAVKGRGAKWADIKKTIEICSATAKTFEKQCKSLAQTREQFWAETR